MVSKNLVLKFSSVFKVCWYLHCLPYKWNRKRRHEGVDFRRVLREVGEVSPAPILAPETEAIGDSGEKRCSEGNAGDQDSVANDGNRSHG